MVIEVFKTDVNSGEQARMLVEALQRSFTGCSANFDLDDCDRVLRVVGPSAVVEAPAVVSLMRAFGFHAEVLSDDIPELLSF